MTNPYRAMCAELVDAIFTPNPYNWEDSLYETANRARALLDQPVPEVPIATEHARTQEINDLIAETVYGPEGSETSACANAWEVSKLIASLQTRVKALEALDD
jgi:hypothetical protein